jgi:secreted trypsin-like serine protease
MVRLGEWDTQTKNELFQQQDYSVDEIIVHENFKRRNLENDVAIMILKDPVPMSEHINTICLPPENTIFDRTRCFASGNK